MTLSATAFIYTHTNITTCSKPNSTNLTNKEIYTMFKKPTITDTVSLNKLCWFGHVQRMEENIIPKNVLYMNLETTRLRGRPRNRCQDEVREMED
jgi:hypothetical protein